VKTFILYNSWLDHEGEGWERKSREKGEERKMTSKRRVLTLKKNSTSSRMDSFYAGRTLIRGKKKVIKKR